MELYAENEAEVRTYVHWFMVRSYSACAEFCYRPPPCLMIRGLVGRRNPLDELKTSQLTVGWSFSNPFIFL